MAAPETLRIFTYGALMILGPLRVALIAFLLLTCWSVEASPPSALYLSPIFSDGVVLQRDRPLEFYGHATPGAQVALRLLEHELQTHADDKGVWSLKFPSMQAGGPHALLLHVGGESQTRRVWIGDVWICGGQSNMSLRVMDTTEENLLSSDPPSENLHLFRVPYQASDVPVNDLLPAQWSLATTDAARFSAVCYFFGNALAKKLGIPIGLINVSYPSTRAEAWIPENAFKSSAQLSCVRDEYNHKVALIRGAPSSQRRGYTTSALFNGMVAPLVHFSTSGVIWYQGEGNVIDAALYRIELTALISSWRMELRNEALAFVLIQLPGYGIAVDSPLDNGWSLVREAQEQVARALPLVGLVATIDQGDKDLHPKRKAIIGHRASIEALRLVYGRGTHTSPSLVSSQITGDLIRLIFDRNLTIEGNDNGQAGIYVAGSDRAWHPATARVEGVVIEARSPLVSSPIAARYAWSLRPVTQLTGEGDLPVTPFRTDHWPVTFPNGVVTQRCIR